MLGSIKVTGFNKNGLQTRVALDERTVEEYAEAMREGAVFPPVVAFNDGQGNLWLADGFHRLEAAIRCSMEYIQADIRNGQFIDALKYALGCNKSHGLRRTNEDKKRALEMAWDRRIELFGGEPSHNLLAEVCGVSVTMARNFREALQPCFKNKVEKIQMPKRVGANGKTYTLPKRPKLDETKGLAEVSKEAQAEKHVVPLDRFGTEIPLNINAAFEDIADLDDVIEKIQDARIDIKAGLTHKIASYAAVRQEVLVELDNAYRLIKDAKPYCVCRMCQGSGCKACGSRGWQTKMEYERNPEEFRA